ncbi:transferase [Streptomyces sp. HUCO-GS316]|uniref:transferase n=1 Tax=Streptomyces sp. HUCO-GS316 TaxID=2692198 RepID=UPI00136C37BF|nr:transferase [Streptomyces sp. HUCO-GS316]
MSTEHEEHARVRCTVDADGRIVFGLAAGPAEGRLLLLRLRPKKGQPEEHEVRHSLALEPDEEGGLSAVLGPEPVLAEGRWDVYLLQEPGAERERLRPGLLDLRALVDGHLRDRRSSPAVRIPYVTRDGHLAVRAWLRTAHAEAGGIDVTERSTTVAARLHGATLLEGAVVLLRLRGGQGTALTLKPRPEGDGRGFSFTVGHEELAAASGPGRSVWHVCVRPAARTPLVRVARLLDDVADRKEVFVYPQVTLGGAVLRPYYTADNGLSVEVTKAD